MRWKDWEKKFEKNRVVVNPYAGGTYKLYVPVKHLEFEKLKVVLDAACCWGGSCDLYPFGPTSRSEAEAWGWEIDPNYIKPNFFKEKTVSEVEISKTTINNIVSTILHCYNKHKKSWTTRYKYRCKKETEFLKMQNKYLKEVALNKIQEYLTIEKNKCKNVSQ